MFSSISLRFSLSIGYFGESFASTSDAVDCFSGTKSASKSTGMFNIKIFYLFFYFFENFSGAVTFFDNESNWNLQTTIRYRRWSVLWFSYCRLNKPSAIDKILIKAANLVRYVFYDVKVCQFSWNTSSN